LELGLRARINTIMQPCFFQLSGVLPVEEAFHGSKRGSRRPTARRDAKVVEGNFTAVDRALSETDPGQAAGHGDQRTALDAASAEQRPRLRHQGHRPPDAREKRSIAQDLPIWDPDLCTDCGR